ncbi:MAG TPA: endolytic transglycosylase MltG, partial [Candidatus Limnocylindrales bacterium]|nr:endolytic transglycosylase MltG [Candidatus Limnocylindrales bacterium]
AGNFALRRNMTPDEVITGLIENRIVITVVPVTFRESLRIEQMTALLQIQSDPVTIDPQEFYELATNPPAELLAEYPWLAEIGRPEGATLEGYLGAATYQITKSTTAEDLIRMMLDRFAQSVGPERMQVPESRGMTFHQIVTLASIVEREAVLDDERPLIAGVFQNRLSAGGSTSILGADPTVFYGLDTVALRDLPFEDWQSFYFWRPPGVNLQDVTLPEDLAGYHSYQVRGLPPGPICTPSLASIEAALAPDTADGYLYFLAIPDGGGEHVFAKTEAEHNENRRKYGYL